MLCTYVHVTDTSRYSKHMAQCKKDLMHNLLVTSHLRSTVKINTTQYNNCWYSTKLSRYYKVWLENDRIFDDSGKFRG